jgi:ATP-dependent RNA helicase DDX42
VALDKADHNPARRQTLPEIVSQRDDDDDDDHNHKEKCHGAVSSKGADDDSDYEFDLVPDEEDGSKVRKARIEPLPPLDHRAIQYPPFRRQFYKEHSEIAQQSEAEVDRQRSEWEISTSSYARPVIPRPIVRFAHAGFPGRLEQEIEKLGFQNPTAIQAQALPVAMSGWDLLALAQTGSGKVSVC